MRERKHQQTSLKIIVPPPPRLPHVPINPISPLSSTSSNSSWTSTSSSTSPEIDAISLSDLKRLSYLGGGSAGNVYKVSHKLTGAIYALKVVRCGDDAAREADILRRIDSSEHVVKCVGIFDGDGGGLSFVMEYMGGGSLADLISEKRRLPEETISAAAAGVLKGLRYLHGLQLVHRDIKPSNLMIDSKGKVKISDFGATVSGRVGSVMGGCDCDCGRGFSRGTWAYMSPERMDPERWGGGGDGCAGDVWAVGVVAMECYVGRFPFVGPGQKVDWVAMMWAVCYADIDVEVLAAAASPEFRGFCRRCLERDWRRRGTVEELLLHPFVTKYEATAEED